MKQSLSFPLAVAAALALSTPVLAANVTAGQGSVPIDVYARYQDGSTTGTVYSVDITWGDMQFTYAKSGALVWNPNDHTYTDDTTSNWQAEGNTITVTNHSNTEVTANFSFAPLANLTDLKGDFSISSEKLDAGIEKDYAGADSVSSVLTLSGSYTGEEEYAKVGTVTIEIQ